MSVAESSIAALSEGAYLPASLLLKVMVNLSSSPTLYYVRVTPGAVAFLGNQYGQQV
jgi:hypothetical protein